MRMKTDFLNSIISVLIITIIIIGITPGMVSALDQQLGNGGNSNNGNSSSENPSIGSSSGESSSPIVSGPAKSSDESPSPVVSSTDKSSSGSSSHVVSSTDKSSSGSSSHVVSSHVVSSTDKSSSGSSSTDKSSTDKSSSVSSSADKSSNGRSNSDKASSGSSSTVRSCIVSYSGIFVPTVLVCGSSSTGSSSLNKASPNKASPEKASPEKASIGSSSTVESIKDGNYNSSSDSSGIDCNGTDNESYFYYIYYTSEGIYVIYSNGSYVFYPSSSGLNAIRDLYWMGDAVSEPEENIYAKELVTRNIISGYPKRFDFAENATSITHIEFEPLMTFKKTTTTAEVLMNKSVFIPKLPIGRIYQYINIFVGNEWAGSPTFLKNGLVGFKVEKAWIKDNNVDESRITLQWYNDSWVPLHTEKVGEDNNYVYFKAETPGFYFFAITEEKGETNTS
jgi:clumping factor A